MIEAKLRYFGPNRKLLGTLAAYADPEHPLSPFSERSPDQARTQALVEKSVALVARLIRVASFPPLRPLRRAAVDLIDAAMA